jgi:hypothetical protein
MKYVEKRMTDPSDFARPLKKPPRVWAEQSGFPAGRTKNAIEKEEHEI